MGLYLVPAHQDNIDASITKSVPSAFVLRYLRDPDFEQLVTASGGASNYYCWAMTERNRPKFMRMTPGDEVMLTVRHTGKFGFIGDVLHTVDCVEFGNALWPSVPNDPWRLVYFLEDVEPIDIDKAMFLTHLGYKPNFPVFGTIRVRDENIVRILQNHSSVRKYVRALQTGDALAALNVDDNHAGEQKQETSPKEKFLRPSEFLRLLNDIETLKNDALHQERAHEALVEAFYEVLGYKRYEDIKHRQGSVDIAVHKQGNPKIVNEVKRDWGLSVKSHKTVDQAYRYANRTGARFVVITNGDYYGVFDREIGLSIDDNYVGEFRLSQLTSLDPIDPLRPD